ncbi:DsbC family protein [Acinetobacter wuhouensis]|uniref:Thiol:disulfide interchange protein n=1 Tax=Acinetobacter wuhouensis TaxID=1879050 RepID=A0A385C1M6_9GAMM|nr:MULTISPECIES: DsbC family protein [Acinetobacter]AXQ20943.1 DsbC family protein [Acinetobacter wuhouensis]AYO55862.1 DsbC family protein [Acinetobacter wuhouensis]RZG45504.1 DsbC family protein [Acinetobacter wuhouensis]RZG73116.1 DsbC family protein [Acinetobacter sp. WCHAc060025]
MLLNRSKLMLACLIAGSISVSACSKNQDSKKDDTLTATAPATGEASNLTDRDTKQKLIQTLQANFQKAGVKAKILDAKPTEMPNLYWISMEGMSSVYATADGKFLIQGDVIRLGGKELSSIGDSLQAAENKKHLSQLKTEDLLVYPAKGKTKHVIYVFTDASCPYCHKLHEHIPEINAKGIEVRYIAWPRGEQFMPAMESVWCSPNRQTAFDQAITGAQLPPATCQNPVRAQYELGLKMGVNGTPAIYNVEGEHIGAYMTADEIESRLNK